MATIYFTNGTSRFVKPKNGADFQLDELQDIVGGYIEIINLRNGKILVVNEEGKCDKLELNLTATMIAHNEGRIAESDCIVGNVLFCDSEQVK